MSRRVSFTVTEQEHREIQNYVKAKKRWRDPAALARDALWQMIERNQAGGHRKHEITKRKS